MKKKNYPDKKKYKSYSGVKPTENVNRIKILMHACKLFAQNGFHGTAMRDITRVCNVTQPTVYYYFENKAQLYLESVRLIHATVYVVMRKFIVREHGLLIELLSYIYILEEYRKVSSAAISILSKVMLHSTNPVLNGENFENKLYVLPRMTFSRYKDEADWEVRCNLFAAFMHSYFMNESSFKVVSFDEEHTVEIVKFLVSGNEKKREELYELARPLLPEVKASIQNNIKRDFELRMQMLKYFGIEQILD
ncbi:MAG: TetR/AcrR family transcriptional regulator [Leptospiraceae bacterium]|nr:TetR/AcrR family transcriptional regulator [Leptospiraceae bacterium]